MQFAYKSQYSTTMCTFLVTETTQNYKSRGPNVYALLTDATKSFDKDKYSKLFELLKNKNICPHIPRILLNMYLINAAVVSRNGAISTEYSVTNGVKQGGVVSPYLSVVYINPLIESIRNSRVECMIGSVIANVFVYVDDLITLSPTDTALQKLVNKCENIDKSLSCNATQISAII